MKEHSVQSEVEVVIFKLCLCIPVQKTMPIGIWESAFVLAYRGRLGFSRARSCFSKCRMWDVSGCLLLWSHISEIWVWATFWNSIHYSFLETLCMFSDPDLEVGNFLYRGAGANSSSVYSNGTLGSCFVTWHWTGTESYMKLGKVFIFQTLPSVSQYHLPGTTS